MIRQRKLLTGILGGEDVRYGPNLIINPGLEFAGAGGADVFLNWGESAGNGAIADETTLVHSGAHAVKLTQGTGNVQIYQSFSIISGKKYKITFWTMGDGTHGGRISLSDGVFNWIPDNTPTGISGLIYAQYSITLTAPSSVLITIYIKAPSSNGAIAYYDDFSVREINP
jgi:hypothetical protein